MSINADAFRGADKMRRGVQARAQPVGLAKGGKKGRSGSLAVGAQNLHRHKRGPGKAENGQGAPHAVKAHVHMEKSQAVKVALNLGKIAEKVLHAQHGNAKARNCQRFRAVQS